MNKVLIVLLLIFVTIFKMNQEELQQKIDELSRVVKTQGEKLMVLENKPVQLDRLLDNNSKNIIGDITEERLFNSQWRSSIHYLSFFESLDGMTSTVTGTSTVAYGSGKDVVILLTGATSGNLAQLTKTASRQGLVTFSQDSKFRTAFDTAKGGGSFNNTTVYMVVGDTTGEYYGFKITAGNLYGVTKRTSVSESTVVLQTYDETSAILNVEARYFANSRVDFFVNSIQVNSISNSPTLVLPTVSTSVNSAFVDFKITTNAAFTKTLNVSFWEYFQKRNILKF